MKDRITVTIDRDLLNEIEEKKPRFYNRSFYIEQLLRRAMGRTK